MNIYVGNLSYNTTDEDLRAAFAAYGSVTSARVITDKETGRSRGFGFVEMASQPRNRPATPPRSWISGSRSCRP
jgi:RNA recognition motif-containing protein